MDLWTTDGGAAKLHLHPGQAQAWKSDRRFVFVLAGTQGGKTSFGPWWLWREIKRGGSGDYLAVTSTFDLFKLKMLPEMREVFERTLKIGKWWAGSKIIELKDPDKNEFWASRGDDEMWGRIILRSAQAEGGLESATIKAAWLDECGQNKFALSHWEAVLRRLSLAQGRVLGTTTIYNLGWLKSQVYDRWKAGDQDYDVIQFKSTENPAFPQAEYDRAVATMPAWKVRMFYDGEFDRPAGMIFDIFNEDVHVIPPVHIPGTWPRAVGIDPIGQATVALFLAYDAENGKLHVYDEYYGVYGKSTEDHIVDIRKIVGQQKIAKWIGGSQSENQARLDWQRYGIPLEAPPISDVGSGIDRIYSLLKTWSLVIHRNCKHLIGEMGSYSRKLDRNDQPLDLIENKSAYHCTDALRYIIAWLTEPEAMSRITYEPVRIGRW